MERVSKGAELRNSLVAAPFDTPFVSLWATQGVASKCQQKTEPHPVLCSLLTNPLFFDIIHLILNYLIIDNLTLNKLKNYAYPLSRFRKRKVSLRGLCQVGEGG